MHISIGRGMLELIFSSTHKTKTIQTLRYRDIGLARVEHAVFAMP